LFLKLQLEFFSARGYVGDRAGTTRAEQIGSAQLEKV
jgi:hypothetical protein